MASPGPGETESLNCRHRRVASGPDDGGPARCALLERVLEGHGRAECAVDEETCRRCLATWPPSAEAPNPVVASLIYARASRLAETLGPGAEAETETARLRTIAEAASAHLEIIHADAIAGPWNSGRRERAEERSLAEMVPPPRMRHGARVRNWAVGVTTAPRLEPTLGACLESLARAGWDRPRLFMDVPVGVPVPFQDLPRTARDERLGVWPSYDLSLRELLLRSPDADAYMIVQDDAWFYDREPLADYLESVLWPGRRPCMVSLYTGAADTAPEPGWRACAPMMRGSPIALVYPPELARAIVTDPKMFGHRWAGPLMPPTAIGDLIALWARRNGFPVWAPTPSLVQHIGEASTLWPGARARGHRRADRFIGDEA